MGIKNGKKLKKDLKMHIVKHPPHLFNPHIPMSYTFFKGKKINRLVKIYSYLNASIGSRREAL